MLRWERYNDDAVRGKEGCVAQWAMVDAPNGKIARTDSQEEKWARSS